MIYTKHFSYLVYDIKGKGNKIRVITKHARDLYQVFFVFCLWNQGKERQECRVITKHIRDLRGTFFMFVER